MAQADAVGRRRAADQPDPRRDARDAGRAGLPQAPAGAARRQLQGLVKAQEEFDAELPVDQDANDATGTGPLAALGADFDARLTMRDVILIRKGSKVKVSKATAGHYKTRYEPNVGGIVIPVDRGWVSVEAKLGKQKFRFVTTHLEAFGDPKIREAQAKELTKGALKTKEQVILVGDLNSGVGRHNEPEKPGDDLAFKALAKFGMNDNGARQSCCYASLTDANAKLDHTVDHVLTKPALKTVKAQRHRQQRQGAHAVRPVAVRSRRRDQPPAVPGDQVDRRARRGGEQQVGLSVAVGVPHPHGVEAEVLARRGRRERPQHAARSRRRRRSRGRPGRPAV